MLPRPTIQVLSCLVLVVSSQPVLAAEPADETKPPFGLKKVTIDPKEDELVQLQKRRFNEAVDEAEAKMKSYEIGRGSLIDLLDSSRRLAESGLDVFVKPDERIRLLTRYRDFTKLTEKITTARYEAAISPKEDLHLARYQRLDAEIALLKAKRAAKKPQK